jgi:glycosyltransferase involved in cell wall biosynthesis
MTGSQPRIGYLTYGSGVYDARVQRMARTARDAGCHVTIYARWYPGLTVEDAVDGIRLVRAPFDWKLAVPGLRRSARRRAAAAMRQAATAVTDPAIAAGVEADASVDAADGRATPQRRSPSLRRRILWTVLGPLREPLRRWRKTLRMFPLYGLGWAAALEGVAEPADIWHGMWAGSLPALSTLRRRFGGATIYDSRDVYMRSRDLATARGPLKTWLEALERRWARAANRVITVNHWYAGLLAEQLGVDRPLVIMNLPARQPAFEPKPNLIRDRLGLTSGTSIVLYQGGLMTARGIEQSMTAILSLPDAVLCLLGFGALRNRLVEQSRFAPYIGRVFVLDPVSPDDLLAWTASADVSVMAIQPTSLNHTYTTPQKLFETIAVGVPVVAADLPGMAEIVRETDAGALCDPTDPAAIAAAVRKVLDTPPEVAAARRERILAAARDRYNWETEAPALLGLYRELLDRQ